jgi:hypothetical protein
MKKIHGWSIAIFIVAVLLLVGCAQKAGTTEKEVPVHIEEIEGSDFKMIELTEKAFARLGIQTTTVLEEAVYRQRTVGGVVMTAAENGVASPLVPVSGSPDTVYVKVRLNSSDLRRVDRTQPARILPLSEDSDDNEDTPDGLEAEEVDGPEDEGLDDDDNEGEIVYEVKNTSTTPLVAGQRVRVAVSLSGSGANRRVIPYASVIYGLNGETWVYSNPEGNFYVRQPIVIDYIEGDLAILSEGPEVGTKIVTVGVAELYGAESGVGGH